MRGIALLFFCRRCVSARLAASVLLVTFASLALSAPSTVKPSDAAPVTVPVSSEPKWLGEMGGFVYFYAYTAPYSDQGGLFKTDGTAAGTTQLSNDVGYGVYPYQLNSPYVTEPRLFISAGTKAYFVTTTAAAGQEVWVTDGTTAGTHQVADIYTGSEDYSTPMMLGLIGTDLIFGEFQSDSTLQLYRTDGTAPGTHVLSSFEESKYGRVNESVTVGGKIFVSLESALCNCNEDLWVTDGTRPGTVQIDSNEGGPWHLNPYSLRVFGNSVALLTNTENKGNEPSFIDSATNALTILDLAPGSGSGAAEGIDATGNSIAAMDGFILFVTNNEQGGLTVRRTDGTLAGTATVKDLGPDLPGRANGNVVITRVGERALFLAENAQGGLQLWSSDGTAQGTLPLMATPGGAALIGVGGTHAYYGVYNVTNYRVVATDGTVSGTHVLDSAGPLDSNSFSYTYVAGDDDLTYIYEDRFDSNTGLIQYLYAYHPASNTVTHLHDSIAPEEEFIPPVAYNHQLYFALSDAAHANQPWVSDGTVAGTHILKDLTNSVVLSADSLVFDDQTVNTRSAARTVTLTNHSLTALTLKSITLTGSQAHDFSLTKACGSTLAAGASCTIAVAFTPILSGLKNSTVNIIDSVSATPHVLALSGLGQTPAVVTLSTTSLTFTDQAVGSSSAAKLINLRNSGSASLTLSSIRLTGDQAHDFTLTKTCGAVLTPGASCTVSVAFTPVVTGWKTSSVSIVDSATGSPHVVALSGNAVSGKHGAFFPNN